MPKGEDAKDNHANNLNDIEAHPSSAQCQSGHDSIIDQRTTKCLVFTLLSEHTHHTDRDTLAEGKDVCLCFVYMFATSESLRATDARIA